MTLQQIRARVEGGITSVGATLPKKTGDPEAADFFDF